MDATGLATGDLILFTERRQGRSRTVLRWLFDVLDAAIAYVTRSPYVHVGLVIVDPPFLDTRGTFLWESGYEACVNPETGKQNIGVRLTPIAAVLGPDARGTVFVRKCTRREQITDAKLRKIHSDVFLKPYDVCMSDWLLATVRLDARPQKTDRFWCSAFVSYVLTHLGFLPETTDWSIVRPCDLSSSASYLAWSDTDAHGPVYAKDAPLAIPRV